MQLLILIFGIILAANHAYGTQQIQMPESASFMTDDDLNDQLDRIKHNITELWSNFNELKTVLTQTLNHLRVHQAELEETVHMLEHKHDGPGGTPGAYTDDHHHHHSGEQHSDDSHSHGSDDHHHHSGEQHSHGSDHSHSGESHSGDSHSHGDDSHSHGSDDSHSHGGDDHHHHSGEQHSHGSSDHYHSSYSHSHSHSGHEMDGDNHQHGDSHEKSDNLQQTQQGADSILEPLVQPTNVQQHYHQQQPHMGTPSSSMKLITDKYFNSHHHHHQHSRGRIQRNRTVEIPKFSEFPLYDFAVCNVQPNRAIPEDQQQEIMGRINLWQKKTGGPLNFHLRLQGFEMGDHHQHHDAQQSLQKEEDNETPVTVVGHKHGFHIHSLGDLSNGCQSTGPHYNPKNVNHGGPNALIRHVGDLGNIECDDQGNVNIVFNDDIASMRGPYSVIGKSINIHANQDDYGLGSDEESLRTGNAGTRLACCVIEKVEKLPIKSLKYIKVATLHQN